MSRENSTPEIFKYGSTWLRADFHLHTNADRREFQYSGEDNSFVSDYVAALKGAGIQIGVITNHNKFDLNEFRALRKKARREDIYLLPGVELSVNDGANGIHILIVFSDQWLDNGNDYISPFITGMFPGKAEPEFQQKNGRSDKNILQIVEELEKNSREYFLIEVEGSDCKSLQDIGKGKQCYVKLGTFSFDAVKFALIDKESRVSKEPKEYSHSHIQKIRFTGGTLAGQDIYFSPELNTMIGIRGSGKSSILEVIRYALEIPFGEKAGDQKYKEKLVGFTLESGGKVEIDAMDRYGQQYRIRRVWKEPYSEVLIDGQLQPGVSIRETVIHKPIYFGQKDLSSTGEGFEKDLVDKLLGSKVDEIRRNIADQKQNVIDAVDRILKVNNIHDQIEEQKKIKQDTEHRLKLYTDHGLQEKLQKRLDFDVDGRTITDGIEIVGNFVSDLTSLLAQHEDEIRNFKGYQSKQNAALLERFYEHYEFYVLFVEQIKKSITAQLAEMESLMACQKEFSEIRKGMVEEFAEIERKLAGELKNSGTQNISSEEFLSLKKKLTSAEQLISVMKKQGEHKKSLEDALLAELHKLNELWLEEFNLIKTALNKVGAASSSISIAFGYKEDREAFLAFMKDVFKGSGIRDNTYQGIVNQYPDFVAIYKDINNATPLFGSNPQTLTDLFMKNLKTLLTYQTPNRFTIMYRGKELQHHSLGQRASALILFVLSQKENDLIIIDQPEDDLDNQTIYEDVIKLIRVIKPNVQFIMATHNPNIPVLGDAEQVHGCSFMDNKISVCSGSVDNQITQRTIVDIMEGGQEAFNRRKEIYQIWKP